MRYMMLIKHFKDYDHAQVPAALYAAMGPFVEGLIKQGIMIDGAGLQPMAKATQVRLARGKIAVTDGPFAETKEIVGGYALCEFKTREEAVAMATQFMELHRIHWPAFEGLSEVRQLESAG
jgi:hypothetical protein